MKVKQCDFIYDKPNNLFILWKLIGIWDQYSQIVVLVSVFPHADHISGILIISD